MTKGQDKQAELDLSYGGVAAAPSWMDQCLESGFSEQPDWQLESLFGPIPLASVAAEEMKVGEARAETVRAVVRTRPSAPTSPESSDSGVHHLTNPIPRHKRPSHKRAELKRRDKIKTELDALKAQVPSLANKGRMSECAILSEAAEYTKHLLGDCERFATEAGNLRREIVSLSSDIQCVQSQLPATGLKQAVEKTQNSLDKMYANYRTNAIRDNWKFFIFGFFMDGLFDSYREKVSSDNPQSFTASIQDWVTSSLSLSNLRSNIVEKMRDITRQTAILTDPASLPEQARASVAHLSNSATSAQSSFEVPHVSTSVASTPSISNVSCPSAPVVLAPSSSTTTPHVSASSAAVPSSSDFPRMSASAALVAASSSPDACLSTLLGLTPSSPDVPSVSASTTSMPSVSEIVQLLVSQPPASSFVSPPQLGPSVTHSSAQSLNQSSVPSIPGTTVRQSLLPPQFLFAVTNPSSAGQAVGRDVQNRHHQSTTALAGAPRRKRASGPPPTSTVAEKEDMHVVARKRVSFGRLGAQPPAHPVKVLPCASAESSGQQAADLSDIGQLAVSVQEASQRGVRPPVAVVTPTLPLVEPLPTSSMADLLGSQYQDYDFDLTDIPLPDL